MDDMIRIAEPGQNRFEGNRRERRKAAALARKGGQPEVSAPVSPDGIFLMLAAARAEVETRRQMHVADRLIQLQRYREWQAVKALHGVIIDILTPEERAARDATFDEACL